MLRRLHAAARSIEMRFPYFVKKTAPVSGVQSQLDHEVCWHGSVSEQGVYSFWMHVAMPAKRPDEKYVTERAYDNPRFRRGHRARSRAPAASATRGSAGSKSKRRTSSPSTTIPRLHGSPI